MYKGDYLRTPKSQITMGQFCIDDTGQPAVAVKRGKKGEFETVPISYLIHTLSDAQQSMETQINYDYTNEIM